MNEKNIEVQLASSQAKIDQAKTLLALYRKADPPRSKCARASPVNLIRLPVPMQVGTHVTAGTSLAEVVQLGKLKAALQIAETQARDISIGLPASIDTHNGVVQGHVTRIDPAVLNGTRTVDVQLDGPLPAGAVKGLSVDGTIDLEHLHDVLYVGRPALGNENSTLSLFKESPDHKTAERVQVKVGRASVNSNPGARRVEGRRHRNSFRHVALRQRRSHSPGVRCSGEQVAIFRDQASESGLQDHL